MTRPSLRTAPRTAPRTPPRHLLALESATDRLSVAVLAAGEVVALTVHGAARQHSAALLGVVDETLRASGIALGEVDAMAISAGPGSFTSLRIGLATLKGLAFGRELPVVGISTLEAMAFGVLEDADPHRAGAQTDRASTPAPAWTPELEVLALLDARRGEWYAGAWRAGEGVDGVPVPTLVEGLYDPARLAADLPRPVVGVSPERLDWRATFEAEGLRFTSVISGPEAGPRADRIGRLALLRLARGEGERAATLSARYLRRAEAEAKRVGQQVEAGETERTGRTGPR